MCGKTACTVRREGRRKPSLPLYYTPPSLTEPIVQHTLEPLVYQGPAEGLPKEQWTLKSPKDILELKVCDMAMGSGAFLVQACRYLTERLTEAWEIYGERDSEENSRGAGDGVRDAGESDFPAPRSALLAPRRFGEKSNGNSELTGFGSLETIHGLGRAVLPVDADISQGGVIRHGQPDSSGIGISPGEHCGGPCASIDERFSQVSQHREGVFARTGGSSTVESAGRVDYPGIVATDAGNVRTHQSDAGEAAAGFGKEAVIGRGEGSEERGAEENSRGAGSEERGAEESAFPASRTPLPAPLETPRTTPFATPSTGSPTERLLHTDADERLAIARRVVADRCLYGVDINPMAVEMAKLSLWLITMDAKRPFTFLDHAFKCGDSLLGVTSLEQLENFSLRPGGGKQLAFATLNLWRHIEEAKKKREALEALPSDTPAQIAAKTALYKEAEEAVAKLNAAADVLVAVELQGLKGRAYEQEREKSADHMMVYWKEGLPELQAYAQQRLGTRRCLHWALAFPEITEAGGFHAFVGNPPFVGGKKFSALLGEDYKNYLVRHLAGEKKGSADLCAYFFLRVGYILRQEGIAGLIATNTLAQGDTREVGLDQLTDSGITILRAIASTPWPGEAALEVSHVWFVKGAWQGDIVLNNILVSGITSLLALSGKMSGNPYRLIANAGKSFVGTYVLGLGFIIDKEEAEALISLNPINKNCLIPYLNGEDVNSRPDQSPSRWVINFRDWPLNRLGEGSWGGSDEEQKKEWLRNGIMPEDYPKPVAADYPDLLQIIIERVKSVREDIVARGKQIHEYCYWKLWDRRDNLYTAISGMTQVLVIPETSKYCTFSWCEINIVFSHMTKVISLNKNSDYCLLCSGIHESWAREYSSTLETRLKYAPSDAFETFPFPKNMLALDSYGKSYQQHRQTIMQTRQEGLTKTYNRFHNPADTGPDIAELRRLHVGMDEAVAAAYGWQDMIWGAGCEEWGAEEQAFPAPRAPHPAPRLQHGFHETKQGIRYTISEEARREVLDRLLELNHQRYAEEVAAGLHDKKASKPCVRAIKTAVSGQLDAFAEIEDGEREAGSGEREKRRGSGDGVREAGKAGSSEPRTPRPDPRK